MLPINGQVRGVAGGQGAMASNRRFSGFFSRKKLACWDVGPALFSKVILFSLPEVFCGLPRAQVLRSTATTNKSQLF